MVFNSPVFLIFITLFFALWPVMRRHNQSRWVYITAASLLFYGWWDWRFVFLLIFSGLIDYFTALGMEAYPDRKKILLYISLTGNLGSLFVFKYSGFVAHVIDGIAELAGIHINLQAHIPSFALILPIGISFYTFQSLNYTIDVYKGELKPARNIFHFFAYLSLFPHLVAGPILRAKQMIPQMMKLHLPAEEELWEGMKLIAWGFFKKMVIADNIAVSVNYAFNNPFHVNNTLYWWVMVILFAFQIYYDFSGYSDIAIGLLRWMGYYVPANFNHPYTSTSLREFWQRWHISLSTWFRDYVYIPLGGSKSTGWRGPNINMWITMLLSGIWHGASGTFVLWGACHAAFLNIERVTNFPDRLKKIPGGLLLCWVITMVQVLVAWVFFRSATFSQAIIIIRSMFNFQFADHSTNTLRPLLLIVLAALPEIWYVLPKRPLTILSPKYQALFGVILIAIVLTACVYFRGPGTQFIYFQF